MKLNPHRLILTAVLITGCARVHIIPAREHLPERSTIAPPLAALPIGEKLTYQISWWGVPVGTVTLSATASNEPATKGLTRLHCEAVSNAYFNAFYPVRVRMTSFVDPKTRAPRRFEAYVKRRRREHQSTITFDPGNRLAHHELPKGRSAEVPITSETQDGLSLLYHARMLEISVEKEVPLTITADGKNWPLTAHILRTGTVKVANLGRFQAVEGEIQLAYPVPFFEGARAWVWMSADSPRIPLLARIHSRIGPVTVVLVSRNK